MGKIKVLVFSFLLVAFWGCTNNERSTGLEELQKKQLNQELTIGSSDQYSDSIQNIESKMESLKLNVEATREQIRFLSAKKDSILKASEQIRISLEQVKSKKINPGIEGVNLKLNELKGQKENLQEQQELQKLEVLLAEKKIELQKEEKEVYAAQRKALWDKGAPPADFVKVDSLLAGIDSYLKLQTTRLKELNRNIADIDEQVAAIDQQRNSLSTKIRSNYTAQKIYEEYSAEEELRLDEQLANVEEQLRVLLFEQDDLNSKLAMNSGNKNYMQLKQDELSSIQMMEEARLQELAQNEMQAKETKAIRNKRVLNAFIIIVIAGLILYALYYIGKKRKSKKLKK